MNNIQKQLNELIEQKRVIELEIKRLQKALNNQKERLSKDEKIAIFKSLFIGRFDIYLKKWISKDLIKEKYYISTPKFKKESYLPLTNDIIELHLRGVEQIATYPILTTNKVKYLTIKVVFEDIKKLNQTFQKYNINTYLEKTSSSDYRFWVFFLEEVDVKNAKKFAEFILKSTKINGKFIPNQEFVNSSNLGEYIELPLHLKHREEGKTVFIDINSFEVIENQWEYLKNIKRFDFSQIQKDVFKNKYDEKNLEFDEIDYPQSIKIYLYDGIYVNTCDLSKSFLNLLKSYATFPNPQIKILLNLRKPLFNTPKFIKSYEESINYLKLPRGLWKRLEELFLQNSIRYDFEDKMLFEKAEFPDITYVLRDEQKEAILKLKGQNFSICVAPPGFGKTLIGAKMITLIKAKTIVIVNKNMLLDQWVDRFIEYFGFDKKQIGYLGKGKNTLNGYLDIATMQSLKNTPQIIENYSFAIVDECHHIPAVTFEQIIKRFKGGHILGLSATPNRKDGFEPILFQQLGDIAYTYKQKKSYKNKVLVIRTEFKSDAQNYTTLINEIVQDKKRNNQIVEEIIKNRSRSILVLTDRIEHINELEKLLKSKNLDYLSIHGSLNKKEQSKNMLKVESAKLIIATTSFFGEGIDFPHLNCIIFATPISYYGRLIQYLGRIGRNGQDCLAIDFLDSKNAMLNSAFKKRKEGYIQMHYSFSKGI